jgi:FkbM family methyltransferase
MPWISFAQNGEDVRIARAFADRTDGFYIDVGANHPVDLSVTKHFYESGWTGINIEPLPQMFAQIVRDRQRDINLNIGCSNRHGSLTLYAARGRASGLSTLTAEEVAIHERNGFGFDRITIPVTTLADICATHARERTIDFMSIDVEGHEREVLEGADFDRFRPRILLVEATRPNTTVPTHDRWEHLIVSHRYLFAAFDGLNRYYVRREDERLAPIIALAPNVFDDFVPHAYQRRIDALSAEVEAYRAASTVTRSLGKVLHGIGMLTRWMVTRDRARARAADRR